MTPVWETRSCRGFHSSAEEGAQTRNDALTKTRRQRENSFRFMNDPKTALWLETMRTNSRATIEGMSTGEGIEGHRLLPGSPKVDFRGIPLIAKSAMSRTPNDCCCGSILRFLEIKP